MLNSNQNNWIRLGFTKLLLNVANSIGVIRDPVSQSIFKIVRRNDNHSDINMAVLKVVPNMNDIPCEKVATTRNLNLHTDTRNNSMVVSKSLNPINIAALGLHPICVFSKLGIDRLAHNTRTVRLLLVEHANVCGNENLLQLKKNVCQSEPTNLLS